MIAFDNTNPGIAEVFFAVAFVLAAVAAIIYATTTSMARWAPVTLALSFASLAVAFWVA